MALVTRHVNCHIYQRHLSRTMDLSPTMSPATYTNVTCQVPWHLSPAMSPATYTNVTCHVPWHLSPTMSPAIHQCHLSRTLALVTHHVTCYIPMSPVTYHVTCYIVLCHQLGTFPHITYQHIGHIPCLLFRKMPPPPPLQLIL